MKKKIIGLALFLLLFASVVSASSINGDYQGMPIVKIKSGDRVLETDEVPGFIYEGHTVVPISTLRQLGASVTWDAYGYTVDVKLPQSVDGPTMPNIADLMSSLSDEVSYIEYTANSTGLTQLSFSLKFDVGDNLYMYQQVIGYGTESGVQQLRLVDQSADGYIYFFKTVDIRDMIAGKLTEEEFQSRIETHPKQNNQPSNRPAHPLPVINNSNVNSGDSRSFEFIGVNDFTDNVGIYHIAGQIKNITGKTMVGGVEITITLFDENGNVVGTRSGYANGASRLSHGEVASFDIPFLTVPNNYASYEIKAKS